MQIKIFTLCIIIICCIFISGCIGNDQLSPGQNGHFSQGKYVVLEQDNNLTSIIYEGSYGLPPLAKPFTILDYTYMSQHGSPYVDINDSLKVEYIVYKLNLTPARVYDSAVGYGAYELPSQIEDGPRIIDVSGDGTVSMIYDNQTINIKPGKTWQAPPLTWDSSENGTSLAGTPWAYKAHNSYTKIIKNIGVFNKSDIKKEPSIAI